ncbi:lipopolysaccharide biosynthesis protein [Sphingomonas xanthus]|uniref:Oligosaccharide flippase family protein n=1 Tax=Sphingomonas xanthus TaxID=2594473 RepID=A0A516IU49_9SPHN|nr:oligosaccharide flippase family protein [Sphingomonas xanthus]QDP20438.1 oligosaccharide flippase family protein [Sphingomonas xanthus]
MRLTSVGQFKALFRSRFVKNVALLGGATLIGRGVALMSLPLITRLYSPIDLSGLAVFTAIVSGLAVIVCLRFDVMIVVPESDKTGANLLALSLLSTVTLSVLSIPVMMLFLSQGWIDIPRVSGGMAWLVALGLFLSGCYASLQSWTTRRSRFVDVSITRVSQSIFGAAATVGSGLIGWVPHGLYAGRIVNMGGGSWSLIKGVAKHDRPIFRDLSYHSMSRTAAAYFNAARLSSTEALLNTGSQQASIILLAVTTGPAELGHFFVAQMVMFIPLRLLGSSISQVFLPLASRAQTQDELRRLFARTAWGLITTAVLICVPIALIAPFTFGVIFGAEWMDAGRLVVWMLPWSAFQLISYPLSAVMHVSMRQGTHARLSAAGACLRIGAVVLVGNHLPNFAIEAFCIANAIFYILSTIVYYNNISSFKSIKN